MINKLLIAAVLLALGTGGMCAQGPAAGEAAAGSAVLPPKGPIQAELMDHLSARKLAVGETVFAKVTQDWGGQNCFLRTGSVLEGTIAAASSKKGMGTSEVALTFRKAQCNGSDSMPFPTVLAAISKIPENWINRPDAQMKMPMSFTNPAGNGNPGFGAATAGDMYITHLELTGVVHKFPMGPKVKPGAVIDIKGLKLDVGTGPDRSSVISSHVRDVTLEKYTQMLLVPAEDAFRTSAASLSATAAGGDAPMPTRPKAVPPPVDTLEHCDPPGCVVDFPVDETELTGKIAGALALGPLGYAPRARRVMYDLDDESALAWVGAKQLLFTFNPHPLIRRKGAGAVNGPTRMIRAVLLDAASHKVLRAVDWELPDARRYLWQLGRDRVLAHVGNELRVYGPDLEVEKTIALAGPLMYVRIAPNGELVAYATERELHSRELHARLREKLGYEPEEDVDVSVLNKDFQTMAQATSTSGLMPPILLNEGQVKLLAQPKMRYRIAMSTWDGKAVTLARFESRCTPALSSFAPDLLLLLSCQVVSGDSEYRVVNAEGKLLLSGTVQAKEIGIEVVGNSQNQTFALKLVRAVRELEMGQEFQAAELEAVEVRIYRASDGRRLSAVRAKAPAVSRGTFALSQDGTELAVVAGDQIQFFPVPAK